MKHARTAIRPRPLLAMVAAMLGLVLGCSGGASNSSRGGSVTAPTRNTIVMNKFSYVPASLTVDPGTTITVVNQDPAPHTVTAKDKSFDSGTLAGGQRAEIIAPAKPGNYPYLCTIHQYMTGTLIVK